MRGKSPRNFVSQRQMAAAKVDPQVLRQCDRPRPTPSATAGLDFSNDWSSALSFARSSRISGVSSEAAACFGVGQGPFGSTSSWRNASSVGIGEFLPDFAGRRSSARARPRRPAGTAGRIAWPTRQASLGRGAASSAAANGESTSSGAALLLARLLPGMPNGQDRCGSPSVCFR